MLHVTRVLSLNVSLNCVQEMFVKVLVDLEREDNPLCFATS